MISVFFCSLCRNILIDNEGDKLSTLQMRRSVRIQQPSVRLNKNLMKIKMEEDYNPIDVLKQESMEGNETEVGDEVQGSSALLQVKLKPEEMNLTNGERP